VYLLTVFFEPERVNARNAAFTWLPASARDLADRIEIRPGTATGGAAGKLSLVRINGAWFADLGSLQVPVKQGRIDDLFRILADRGAFPRIGSAASSHSGLGLSAENASRLEIRGGAAIEPLLDLLIGNDNAEGREVYLRKNGENEYRLGDALIKSYVEGEAASWYDLKLFSESRADMVQRIRVSPVKDGEGDEDYVLARNEAGWLIEGSTETPSADAVDTYVRAIFDIQGDDFLADTPPVFDAGRLSLELGDGSVITVQAAEEQNGKRPVMVSGSSYVYLLSESAVRRILRERLSLE
jgi:hypothetical protein